MDNLSRLEPLAQKVLLVGWDSVDWRVIHPLLAQGKMPYLQRLIGQGVRANLSTIQPALSPMVWTSIATGKRPYKHGIHGFTEPIPDGSGVRPVSSLSRTTKAVWNILHQTGRTCNVVGWWPSHPAEPIRGVMVSNHYHRAVAPQDKPWPMNPGTVHPQRLAKALSEFRVHPSELSAEDLVLLVPRLAEIDQTKDKRPAILAKIVAEASSVHGASTALMQLEPWDFMAVYYDALDHFSHAFMNYHPPRQNHVSEEDFAFYSGVVEGAYRFHDLMLGALLRLADDQTTVILMSDHGFHPDEQRPSIVPVEPAGPAAQHRNYGVLVMKGPGIRQNEMVYGASILDICPSILRLFGLPVGADMDGKVLVTAFREAPSLASVPSWDDREGESGRLPAAAQLDPADSAEAVKQLAALGYIEPLPANVAQAVEESVRELKYNLAQAYLDGGRPAEAAQLLEEIWEQWPEEHRFGIVLLQCLRALRQKDRHRAILGRLEERIARAGAKAAAEFAACKADAPRPDEQGPEADRKRQHLRQLAWRTADRSSLLAWLKAEQALLDGDAHQAKIWFDHAAASSDHPLGAWLHLGAGFLRLRQYRRAIGC